MARRKQKLSITKKIVIIGLVLIVIQGVYLIVFGSRSEPLSMREAIVKAVESKGDLSVARKEQAKIQLALADYQVKNGRLPASLDELVPTYFDSLPLNPDTNQPFKYRIDGARYVLGDETPKVTTARKTARGDGDAGAPTTAEEQKALIDSLSDNSLQTAFVYDSTGKRDPFKPFDFAPKPELDSEKTPLEQYNISALKLTAVLEGFDEPKAIVENAAGRGFTITKGTKIGTNNGEVVEILRDKVLILETEIDFTGQKKTRTVEMKLRTKDQAANERQGRISGGR